MTRWPLWHVCADGTYCIQYGPVDETRGATTNHDAIGVGPGVRRGVGSDLRPETVAATSQGWKVAAEPRSRVSAKGITVNDNASSVSGGGSTPRCAITDLPTDMCAHCRKLVSVDEQVAAERKRLLATGGWMVAQYPGRCENCGESFEVGAAIRFIHGVGGWRAECCGDGAT